MDTRHIVNNCQLKQTASCEGLFSSLSTSQDTPLQYVRTRTEDVNSWAMETRKLSGLCVLDMDYFEEFLQKNCPIAYSLADTYILLRELREVTPAVEVF